MAIDYEELEQFMPEIMVLSGMKVNEYILFKRVMRAIAIKFNISMDEAKKELLDIVNSCYEETKKELIRTISV